MISRIWRGWTTPENAARYEQLLRTDILPKITAKGISGYRGAHLFQEILKRFDTHSQHYDVRLTPETTSGLLENRD